MPTLFRLLTVIGVVAALAYGAMFALANAVRPQQREIVEAVAMPQNVDLHTGRSAAETLNSQAAALVRRKHHQ